MYLDDILAATFDEGMAAREMGLTPDDCPHSDPVLIDVWERGYFWSEKDENPKTEQK